MMKKSFLIIYAQTDSPQTGGQVVDFEFINQINKSGLFNVSYLRDADLKSISNLYYNWYLLFHIQKFMRYDVIFMNSRNYPRLLFFVIALRILGFKGKLITYHHHYNFETSKGIVKYIHKFAELTFLKSVSDILIPSPFVLDLTKILLPSASKTYIPIGFQKQVRGNSISVRMNHRIICVGNIDRRKRSHQIVDVAYNLTDEFPDLKVDIVGGVLEEEYYEEICSLIKEKSLENIITLHGRVSDDMLKELYDNASVFVFPSSYEGYGMVLIEAMSHGLPVVAYNNSAIPYSVKNGYNGFVVEDNNEEHLVDKVKILLTDGTLRARLSKNAIDYVNSLPSLKDMQCNMQEFVSKL